MIPLSTPFLGPPTPPQSVEFVPFYVRDGFLFFSGSLSANKLFLAAKPFGMSSNNARRYMK